ncbi:MAG TPA: thiolase family protein [Pseudonocardia sp.]|nr:thiolase family protein [Pseudonocardia sp.]
MTHRFEHDVCITGLGQSAVGRRLGRSALDLTTEACLAAVADAGLDRADIDGLVTYPGGEAALTHGYGGPPPTAVQDALRLELNWYEGAADLPGQLGAVVAACLAVSSGLARHVLVYRTVTESSAQGAAGRAQVLPGAGGVPAAGVNYWTAPFGAVSAVNWLAQVAARHFHVYGTTREQLGALAVTQRANAALNPAAPLRTPFDLAEYLAARMISTPLCLLDCDLPVDGSTALVVSPAERAADSPRPPVYVEAVGTALRGRASWDQYGNLASMAAEGAAAHLWRRTALRPADVDLAQLYDGFSILALVWLEALGFCAPGEGGAFLGDGSRIALTGELPLNTAGGQLSGGRLHGYGHLHEACLQLRGGAGARQVRRRGGDTPKVAVVSNGGGPIAGCLLLTGERV